MADVKEFYNVDFNDLKVQFKDFISEHTDFLDYNFEGSALSQLLDILVFSLQYQNVYLNMTANELFFRHAQIDDNIYKLANMFNYLPKRKSAAYIEVTLSRLNLVTNGQTWEGTGDDTQPDPPDDWALASGVTDGIYTIEDDALKIEQEVDIPSITQAFTTVIGQPYEVTIAFRTGATQSARVRVGTTDINGNLADSGALLNTDWDSYTVNFVATTTTTYITIGAADDFTGEVVYFDDPRVTLDSSIVIPALTEWTMGSLKLTNYEDIILNTNEYFSERLYEGVVTEETILADGSDFFRFELSERNDIDNEAFFIFVDDPDGGGGFIPGVDPWTNVHAGQGFQLNEQAYYLEHFETLTVKFDDGQRFPKPSSDQQVRAIYLVTSGSAANGSVSDITLSALVPDYDKVEIDVGSNVLVNGTDEESIESVRAAAPLFFTTQHRAITESDFNILVERYPRFESLYDAVLWGGEKEFIDGFQRVVETGPKSEFPYIDLGHVFMTGLKSDFEYLDDIESQDLLDWFENFRIITIFLRYIHPQIVKIYPNVDIKFKSVLNLDAAGIKATIDDYLDTQEGFNKNFHLSNLINFVDDIPEVIETSIDYTSRVTVKYPTVIVNPEDNFLSVRLWNAVVENSIVADIGSYQMVDSPQGVGIPGLLMWNGNTVGTINYETGWLTFDYDFGIQLPVDGIFDVIFQYADRRSIQLNRETFMKFEPIVVTSTEFEETE
jgi:hypothetical protein